MTYLSMKGIRKFMPLSYRVVKTKKGIREAIKQKAVFHLWFHPIDLSEETEKLMAGLEQILKYATQLRKMGRLEIKSMGQIAKDFLRLPPSR
jgi:hypothetical protein